jgi:predicted phosphodiesterase
MGSLSKRRVAVMADIHGNLPALLAVEADLVGQGVDEVIVAGDLVGRGPQGTAVVRHVRSRGWPCLRGNHEDYLITFAKGSIPDAWRRDEEWAAARWMSAELSSDALAFISALPFSLTSASLPPIRVVHGSPTSNCHGIGAWTPQEEQLAILEQVAEPILVCAHTHRPLHSIFAHGMIVNVGSVGLPFNGDWRAQYAILEGDVQPWQEEGDAHWSVDFRKVAYDRDAFYRVYEESGFLAEGGVTAALLRQEVEYARPFLVPFLEWVKQEGLPPHLSSMQAFLESPSGNLQKKSK